MTRFCLAFDNDDDDDFGLAPTETQVEDYDDDDEFEPPHPLGFATLVPGSWGRTRFSLHPPRPTDRQVYAAYVGQDLVQDGKDEEDQDDGQDGIALLNPSSRIHRSTVSTAQLWQANATEQLRLLRPSPNDDENGTDTDATDAMVALIRAGQSLSLSDPSSSSTTTPMPVVFNPKISQQLLQIAQMGNQQVAKIQQKLPKDQQHSQDRYERDMKIMLRSLKEDEKKAVAFRKLEKERQHAVEEEQRKKEEAEAERQRKERQKQEEAAAKQRKEQEQKERQDREAAEARQQRIEEAARKKQEQQAEAAAKHKAKFGHVDKAQVIVEKLVEVRASVEPFEKNKAVSRRRLNMKKICRGRVNTLSADVGKVQAVAVELVAAIEQESKTDDEVEAQLQQNVPGVTPDMARGKQYFLDLLASTVLVRMQAEGFNGYVHHSLCVCVSLYLCISPCVLSHPFLSFFFSHSSSTNGFRSTGPFDSSLKQHSWRWLSSCSILGTSLCRQKGYQHHTHGTCVLRLSNCDSPTTRGWRIRRRIHGRTRYAT